MWLFLYVSQFLHHVPESGALAAPVGVGIAVGVGVGVGLAKPLKIMSIALVL